MTKCQPLHALFLMAVSVAFLSGSLLAQTPAEARARQQLFPHDLVDFQPYEHNPVFSGGGQHAWDHTIRERGYILREEDGYHLWYTGYRGDKADTKYLGYATSPDGIHWTRDPGNPIFDKSWVEDMCVVKHDGVYYMFAEGRDDIAHLLTSSDRRHWKHVGRVWMSDLTNGEPIPAGPYGTPTVWIENGIWYLFYERRDAGVWLATSRDRQVWTNVQDDPVLRNGPEPYDLHAVAMNQVIKHDGRYYAYYHGSAHVPWRDWNTNIATSIDLIHWTKYGKTRSSREQEQWNCRSRRTSLSPLHDASQRVRVLSP